MRLPSLRSEQVLLENEMFCKMKFKIVRICEGKYQERLKKNEKWRFYTLLTTKKVIVECGGVSFIIHAAKTYVSRLTIGP